MHSHDKQLLSEMRDDVFCFSYYIFSIVFFFCHKTETHQKEQQTTHRKLQNLGGGQENK